MMEKWGAILRVKDEGGGGCNLGGKGGWTGAKELAQWLLID